MRINTSRIDLRSKFKKFKANENNFLLDTHKTRKFRKRSCLVSSTECLGLFNQDVMHWLLTLQTLEIIVDLIVNKCIQVYFKFVKALLIFRLYQKRCESSKTIIPALIQGRILIWGELTRYLFYVISIVKNIGMYIAFLHWNMA